MSVIANSLSGMGVRLTGYEAVKNMTPQLQMLKDAAEYADGLNTDPKLEVSIAVRPYGLVLTAQREDKTNQVRRQVKQVQWDQLDAGKGILIAIIDQMLAALKKQVG